MSQLLLFSATARRYSSNTYIYRPQLLNCLNFLVFLPTYLLKYLLTRYLLFFPDETSAWNFHMPTRLIKIEPLVSVPRKVAIILISLHRQRLLWNPPPLLLLVNKSEINVLIPHLLERKGKC